MLSGKKCWLTTEKKNSAPRHGLGFSNPLDEGLSNPTGLTPKKFEFNNPFSTPPDSDRKTHQRCDTGRELGTLQGEVVTFERPYSYSPTDRNYLFGAHHGKDLGFENLCSNIQAQKIDLSKKNVGPKKKSSKKLAQTKKSVAKAEKSNDEVKKSISNIANNIKKSILKSAKNIREISREKNLDPGLFSRLASPESNPTRPGQFAKDKTYKLPYSTLGVLRRINPANPANRIQVCSPKTKPRVSSRQGNSRASQPKSRASQGNSRASRHRAEPQTEPNEYGQTWSDFNKTSIPIPRDSSNTRSQRSHRSFASFDMRHPCDRIKLEIREDREDGRRSVRDFEFVLDSNEPISRVKEKINIKLGHGRGACGIFLSRDGKTLGDYSRLGDLGLGVSTTLEYKVSKIKVTR